MQVDIDLVVWAVDQWPKFMERKELFISGNITKLKKLNSKLPNDAVPIEIWR